MNRSSNQMAQTPQENVILFPFMAQGHLIPYLALALEIEKKLGYTVTIINTPLNIKKLRPSIPPTSSIRLVELPFFSIDHDLPPNAENTDVLPYPLIIRLFEASLSLKPTFTSYLQSLTHLPLCIIADFFFGWTVDVARELGIFHSVFITGGAYGFTLFYSIWLNQPQLKNDSDEFSLPDFPEVGRIHRSQLGNNSAQATGTDPWSNFYKRELPLTLNSDGFLINTVEDFDLIGLDYFRRNTGKSVWAIGPVKYSVDARNNKGVGISSDLCIQWLDKHEEDSVLYICFGSQNTISSTQLMELAIGLEKSGKNFIWVIRPPIGFDINGEFRSEWLPEGFEERMRERNRGILVRKWAPQLEILSHKSTSAFLSHCGWNSVLESLSFGVPIIGWPISADQFYNVKLLEEEVKVCVEVARGNSSEIKHEDVVRVIDLVMKKNGKGEELKKKACEVREMIKEAIKEDDDEIGVKGSSVRALEEFFNMALLMKKKKNTKMD